MAGAVRCTPKDADGPKPGHKHSALYLALYNGTATGTMSRINARKHLLSSLQIRIDASRRSSSRPLNKRNGLADAYFAC